MPFENVDPDAFINVLEEDAVYHIIDDDDDHDDDHEWPEKEWPPPETQPYSDSDDETEVPSYVNYTINNDEDSVNTEPYLLISPIDNGFTRAEFITEDMSDSGTASPHNKTSDDIPRVLPRPEPSPACVPDITFNWFSPLLNELRNVPPTTYLGCHTLKYGPQLSQINDHTCD